MPDHPGRISARSLTAARHGLESGVPIAARLFAWLQRLRSAKKAKIESIVFDFAGTFWTLHRDEGQWTRVELHERAPHDPSRLLLALGDLARVGDVELEIDETVARTEDPQLRAALGRLKYRVRPPPPPAP